MSYTHADTPWTAAAFGEVIILKDIYPHNNRLFVMPTAGFEIFICTFMF